MSVASALPSEVAAIVGSIDPDNYSTGTQTTGWVAAKDFIAFLGVVQAGTLGSSATVDAKIEQATDDSGTSAKDVSGSDIAQLTQASTDQSDKQALINVRPENLDVANGFDHIRLSITIGTASSDAAGILMGFCARHAPASDQDADSVDEIVTV
jgi:hypothetical protein